MSDGRKTICVDFDGVLNPDYREWKGAHVIEGKLPDHMRLWLLKAVAKYRVVILTTRGRTWRGRRAIRAWLKEQCGMGVWYESPAGPGVEDAEVTDRKPPALAYIDDRAIRHEGGELPSFHDIEMAKPWWKQ